MPNETQKAIDWSLQQNDKEGNVITKDDNHLFVDKVREYFNTNSIQYPTFSYADLETYLN